MAKPTETNITQGACSVNRHFDAVVGLSGGVDSAAAVAILQAAGLRCAAATLVMHGNDGLGALSAEARAVADALCAPLFAMDLRELFDRDVATPFIRSYLSGLTPNPCVSCNRAVKFRALCELAEAWGVPRVATGHYARVTQDKASGRYLLRKARHESKDQSYVLASLTQAQLRVARFPLGELSKDDAREIAACRMLPNASKKDSQDICFIPDGDYAGYILSRLGDAPALNELASNAPAPNESAQNTLALNAPAPDAPAINSPAQNAPPPGVPSHPVFQPGPLYDVESGRQAGIHLGAARYTIGQRRGLGLGLGKPAYVVSKDMGSNAVYVGGEASLYRTTLTAVGANMIAFAELAGATRVTAKARYGQKEQPATAWQTGPSELRVQFDEPQRALAPGQAIALYSGDIVVAGATIDKVL